MSGKYEKPTYLTINVKYQGNFKTTRIYSYYVPKIIDLYLGEERKNISEISKEHKSFIVKYVHNLIDKQIDKNRTGMINYFDNWNFHINELVFNDIYYSLKNNNREQKSFDF